MVSDGDTQVEIDENTLNEYVDAINEALKDIQQNIKFIRTDWTEQTEEFLVFCCTFSEPTLK